jgi:hypothetical protein
MNKRRFKRFALFTGLAGLLLAGGLWLCLWSLQRQQALNRQLIAALVQRDDQKALMLVNAGADPNTRLKALPPPSFHQWWNFLVHRSPLPVNDSPTAFLLVCGEVWTDVVPSQGRPFTIYDCSAQSAAKLMQPMLKHGANIEAKDENG